MTTVNEPIVGLTDGDTCNRLGCQGVIELTPSENCSCHIVAPCNSCTATLFYCSSCDWREDDD
jgi:hypothetical protein